MFTPFLYNNIFKRSVFNFIVIGNKVKSSCSKLKRQGDIQMHIYKKEKEKEIIEEKIFRIKDQFSD